MLSAPNIYIYIYIYIYILKQLTSLNFCGHFPWSTVCRTPKTLSPYCCTSSGITHGGCLYVGLSRVQPSESITNFTTNRQQQDLSLWDLSTRVVDVVCCHIRPGYSWPFFSGVFNPLIVRRDLTNALNFFVFLPTYNHPKVPRIYIPNRRVSDKKLKNKWIYFHTFCG